MRKESGKSKASSKSSKTAGKGLIHLYTGEGKGKTTAAVGLAVRAAGAGKKVVFAQFMKGRKTSELNSLELIPGITIVRSDKELGWFKRDDEAGAEMFREVHDHILEKIDELIQAGECDVLIMDEVTYPYNYGIIDKDKLEEVIDKKPRDMEIVMTGRNADELLSEKADYITYMEKIRHPYDKGIAARLGIEY
ncbi:MAG: cob(I)yrinic acid a,c-diamide adenosyltransferase [Butyrivibrio sp.]|nr:cob(I)yrinic acid a,c-diamide adenosyltransferase [Butyrivibrio sp.]